jgi:hypothetical protein
MSKAKNPSIAVLKRQNGAERIGYGPETVAGALGRRVIEAASVAEIEALSLEPGRTISLSDGTGRVLDVIAGDYSNEVAGDTLRGVFVPLADDPGGATKVAKVRFENTINAAWFGLPTADSAKNYAAFVEIEAMCRANRWNLYCPGNVTAYDIGNNNFPFRNTVNTALRDYGGIRVYGDGADTILKTTSNDGADVLQLNAVENLTIERLKVTAILTGTSGAGSNGISITNGGRNIHLDVIAEDLPYVDKTSYLDGGKAISIQPSSSTNPLENITGRVIARRVGYGFGMDIVNDARINNPIKGIDIYVYCDTAYRGVVLSGTANNSAVPSNGLSWGVTVRGTTINCQQHYISNRAWNAEVKLNCVNTTNTLGGYMASDTETFVSSVLGSKNESLELTGSVQTVDVLHRVGGTTNGGGVNGATENSEISLNVDFQSAGVQFDLVNSGGNHVASSVIGLPAHVTSVDFATLLGKANVLTRAGVLRTRDLNNYNTLSHYDSAGVKSFGIRPDGNIESPLTSSTALGAYVGKKAEYDASGAFLGYRPLYG